MSPIPEDSVLRRHYLAAAARRQGASATQTGHAAGRHAKPSSGLMGYLKRLFGG